MLNKFLRLSEVSKCIPSASYLYHERPFLFKYVNHYFNLYDQAAVKKVGPDIVAGQWALRCGARVRWKGHKNLTEDYNALPKGGPQYKLVALDFSDSSVSAAGFMHLQGLEHVEEVKIVRCDYAADGMLSMLRHIRDSLKHLEIGACGNIHDQPLVQLDVLQNLQTLVIYRLVEVNQIEECVKILKRRLPNCDVQLFTGEEPKLRDI